MPAYSPFQPPVHWAIGVHGRPVLKPAVASLSYVDEGDEESIPEVQGGPLPDVESLAVDGAGPDRRIRIVTHAGADGRPQLRSVPEAVRHFFDGLPQRAPSKAEPVLFAHQFPANPVMYGGWFGQQRAPVIFLTAPSRAVLEYVRDDPSGPFVSMGEPGNWEKWGFIRDEQEQLLKRDWHAVPHLGSEAGLFVPRKASWGHLPRAPDRILAFILAFRAVNQACWSVMIDALTGLKLAREQTLGGYKDSSSAKLLGTFVECFRNGRHLGVVEAQVHWGAGAVRMPSHKDGATSLLHLGITLGGRRTFRAGVFKAGDSAGNIFPNMDEKQRLKTETNVWDEGMWPRANLKEIAMEPGSAYLSSPFLFEHAVEYEAATKPDPIIALQCRFAYPSDLGQHVNNLRDDDVAELAEIVVAVLRHASECGKLRMPTLGEVKQGEARVRQIQEAEAKAEEEKRAQKEEEREQRRTAKAQAEAKKKDEEEQRNAAVQFYAGMYYQHLQQEQVRKGQVNGKGP